MADNNTWVVHASQLINQQRQRSFHPIYKSLSRVTHEFSSHTRTFWSRNCSLGDRKCALATGNALFALLSPLSLSSHRVSKHFEQWQILFQIYKRIFYLTFWNLKYALFYYEFFFIARLLFNFLITHPFFLLSILIAFLGNGILKICYLIIL